MERTTRPSLGGRIGQVLAVGIVVAAISAAEPPEALGVLDSFVVSRANLRYDNAPRRENGKAKLQAFVDDNDTAGELYAKLLDNKVTVVVTDGGEFDVTIDLTGCQPRASERVTCRSVDRKVRAKFLASKQGPFLYNIWVTARRLSELETGDLQPIGPVTVRLRYDELDQGADEIETCSPRGDKALYCREP